MQSAVDVAVFLCLVPALVSAGGGLGCMPDGANCQSDVQCCSRICNTLYKRCQTDMNVVCTPIGSSCMPGSSQSCCSPASCQMDYFRGGYRCVSTGNRCLRSGDFCSPGDSQSHCCNGRCEYRNGIYGPGYQCP